MGYTRYWNRTEKPITEEFVSFVNGVIADCAKKGIRIRNGLGEGEPIVSTEGIYLNGNADKDLDHETLAFTNDDSDPVFGFCKTARKPYDYAVRMILNKAEELGLVTGVSSDGPNDEIISDDEYFWR